MKLGTCETKPVISLPRLRRWYDQGFVVPLAIRLHFPLDPWTVAKSILSKAPNAFFLDSVRFQGKTSRYSFLGWKPFHIFKLRDPNHAIPRLRALFQKYPGKKWRELPFFTGGAVGYLGYELAHVFEELPDCACDDLKLDPIVLLFVRNVLIFDLKEKVCFLIANLIPGEDGSFPTTLKQALISLERDIEELSLSPSPLPAKGGEDKGEGGILYKLMKQHPRWIENGRFRIRHFQADMVKRNFKRMVAKAKAYIQAGDIYQANLSQRFSFEFRGSAETLYESLREINPSPFSSFIKVGSLIIASASPERLIRLNGGRCETRPIAGTRPRGVTRAQKDQFRRDLLMSPKERAEHIMLVDLERNDLGRVSKTKTVRVNELMTLEEYSHVIHIVSNVCGQLKKGCDRFDLLKAVFPGGTITGCPKIRSMEIIEELEPFKRHIYTGSIGYLDFGGDMDFNIVIRSFILSGHRGYLQVGAGIVYDSDPEAEYWETLHKAKALIDALCLNA